MEVVIALIMYLNGAMIEHTYKETMSSCLRSKRIAMREINPDSVIFSCKKVKAKTEIYMGGKKILKAKIEEEPDSKYGFRIVKVLDD